MKTLIKRGRVVDPASGRDEVCDILIEENLIAAVGEFGEISADKVVDAGGRLVIPGVVDIAVNLREPGDDHRVTIASELRAAAGAGVTSLCCSPDADPPVTSAAAVSLIQQTAVNVGFCRVFVIGGLTDGLKGKALSEMAALKEAGCIALSNALYPFHDTGVLKRALEYATGFDMPVMLHPVDFALAGGCVHEGEISDRLGLQGIPVSAETAALGQYLALVEDTGARVHFSRLSCARSVEMLAAAKRSGLQVTADVAVHQLFLTADNVIGFNPDCHVLPPFRSSEDRAALQEGLRDGIVDVVCSDHQPHDISAKLAPFASTAVGVSAIETLLPLMLELSENNVVPLESAIAAITCNPARILGIEYGSLSQGAAADICIVDVDRVWNLDEDTMMSMGKNTPFWGCSFKGKVSSTWTKGKLVYEA